MSGSGARCVGLRVEVLGPLRLVVDGTAVDVPGHKRRAVLALLARAHDRAVAVDHLLDAVWPQDPPNAARAALHAHISRLRGHLGPAASLLESLPGGYRLVLVEGALDAAQARSLLCTARGTADPVAAGKLLQQARALWRGSVLADLVEIPLIAAWSVTLNELRHEVDDLLISCALETGEGGDIVGLATESVAEDPLREPAILLLMRALAAAGRGADALRTSHSYRRRLASETGLDPSPALGELERRIASGGAWEAISRFPVPVPGNRLVGRDSEVAALRRMLARERLVTVVGPGGVGKTRLALEVTRHVRDATIVRLAPVSDPAAIPHALAAALDLNVVRGDVLAACVALLAAGPRLAVVDNCEHLLDAVRVTISALVDGCPELTVLATSREPLGLPTECVSRLAPLPVPGPRDRLAVDRSPAPSVTVFVDRARQVRGGFAPGPRELGIVADIVRRLDGMPLAIELAAGRLSSLGLDDLHARLHRSLDLLGDGRGGADGRHRTLRATIEWSYELLPSDERRLFRHLSVFPDGVDLATAEQIAVSLGVPGDPASGLAHLVDASMIEFQPADRTRYRMLETLRTFGLDRLVAEHEDRAASNRLLRWAVDLATWIGTTAATESEPEADAVLRREIPNLRAAWRLARHDGRLDDATALVISLAEASGLRDLTEVWTWARELAADPAIATHRRAGAVLGIAAAVAWLRGDLADVDELARRGLDGAIDDEDRCWCLSALCMVELSRGGYAAVVEHCLQAAALAPHWRLSLLNGVLAAAYAGDLDQANALNDRLANVAVSPTAAAMHHYVTGEIDSIAGRRDQAEQHYASAIELGRTAGSTFLIGLASVGLLTIRVDTGRIDDALRGYREVIDYWERTGNWIQQWTTLRNLANLLRILDDHQPALFLEVAAGHAPEASAVSDGVWTHAAPGMTPGLDDETASRIHTEASRCARSRALGVARQSIDRHLTQ
ncbi:MAG TPA: BTAD domain-containing putative transcriptional regulator [Pseudonocardiaceae bacterium]